MGIFPEGTLTSNRGLQSGDIITEIRGHPYIEGSPERFWNYTKEVLYFVIIEVYRAEYKCQYIGSEDERQFYWPFWDKQPNNGFWVNDCSPVRYYVEDIKKNELGGIL